MPYGPSAYTIIQLEAPLILFIAIFRPLFVYNCANTHTSVLKNLTFPNYKFGKGNYAFYPIKLSRFAEKNEVHKGEPLRRAGGLSDQ